MNTNVYGMVTIQTPRGKKSFWVFKDGNKVGNLKCSCTGKTDATATQMVYNHREEKVECPHCHKQPEVLETVQQYNDKKEAEIEAIRQKKPLKVIKSVFDYSTGIQYYTLNKTIPEEEWNKVSEYFTYMQPYMFEDAEGATAGWYTTEPEKVEEILGITETQEKQEEKRQEETKKQQENKENLETIEKAFQNAKTIPKQIKLNNLLQRGQAYENPQFKWTTNSMYGGGILYIIQKQKIIKIQNNGRDGDDWSINNIQTGGAGAIGTYIPYDETTAQKIKESCPPYKEDK